jgi:hypothetical protein
MSIRLRLRADEIELLGLDKNNQNQYRLTQQQYDKILQFRQDADGVRDAILGAGVNPKDVPDLWLKSKESSIRVKNPHYVPEEFKGFEIIQERIINDIVSNVGNYRPSKVERKGENLLFLSPADIHIGKLCSSFETGVDYNSQIAVKRVLDGVSSLLGKAIHNDISEVLFVMGNDVLHIDNPRRMTTSGTPQDTDGMWYENFITAKRLYVDVIRMIIEVLNVPIKVQYNPSNHDYMSGFFLAQVIEAHFRNTPNVEFDISIAHRKYHAFGSNLIGTTHGDGGRWDDLPLTMAHEASEFWHQCKHRYIYTHHIHHKKSKDFQSVLVESLRSPSESDSWHHRNQYTGNPKAIECFLHHKVFGQTDRWMHIF